MTDQNAETPKVKMPESYVEGLPDGEQRAWRAIIDAARTSNKT